MNKRKFFIDKSKPSPFWLEENIKAFYRKRMKKWALEMIGEDMKERKDDTQDAISWNKLVFYYNQAKQEVRERIKKA